MARTQGGRTLKLVKGAIRKRANLPKIDIAEPGTTNEIIYQRGMTEIKKMEKKIAQLQLKLARMRQDLERKSIEGAKLQPGRFEPHPVVFDRRHVPWAGVVERELGKNKRKEWLNQYGIWSRVVRVYIKEKKD